MNTCTVKECDRPRRRNGPRTLYCEKHTYYWRRYGDPDVTSANSHECKALNANDSPAHCGICGRLVSTVAPDVRFWARVEVTKTCWLWTGSRSRDGYGKFEPATSVFYKAHRFAYETVVGPIPEGLTLDHLCRVRRCVNPDHLEPVTNQENLLRGRLSRQKEATR